MNVQSRKKIELLRRVDLFSELREYELDVIARHSDFVTIEKGLPLFSQDDPADSLYVLESGRIGIVSIEDRSRVSIAADGSRRGLRAPGLPLRRQAQSSAFAEADSVALKFPAGDRGLGSIFSGHAYISSRLVFRLLEIVSDRIWNVKKALLEKSSWIWDLHKQALSDKLTGSIIPAT
jgi:CRP-like cAMP-binding protein